MRIGLNIPKWVSSHRDIGRHLASLAERADQTGFASLWVADHFFHPTSANLPGSEKSKRTLGRIFQVEEGAQVHELLEGWSTSNYLAACTRQVQLGTLVTGVTYRSPGLLLKMVNTLDALSNGRAYLGIGAAWEEHEHHRLGIPYPSTKERFERLEEAVQLALQMWSGEDKPFEGTYYQVSTTQGNPFYVQRPHPRLLIGGGGEKKTLRLVAQYADACNIGGRYGFDELERKLHVLREHCQALGRPYEQIEKTSVDMLLVTRDGRDGTITPSAMLERCKLYAERGIEHLILSIPSIFETGAFELLTREVLAEAQQIPVAKHL